MPLEKRKVVTSFLRYKNKILILKRSNKVGTYQGKWAGISGYLEDDDLTPEIRAKTEIFEEIGLKEQNIKLIKKGNPLEVVDEDKNIIWIVYPFLWEVSTNKGLNLNWENKELRWITSIDEIDNYKTVPKLKEVLKEVLIKI